MEKHPGAGGPMGMGLLELINRQVRAAGSVPMAAAGDVRAAGCVESSRRVFQGCRVCLPRDAAFASCPYQ